MQWLALCAAIFTWAHSVHAGAVCSVPDEQKALVTSLQLNMAKSVGPCVPPDPSILLALNLGSKNLNPEARELLIKQLKEDAIKKVSQDLPFTSGKVALYILALRSSCSDPCQISRPNGNLNLVKVLEEKTSAEIKSIENTHSPMTTYYQVALDVLALCVMSSPRAFPAATTLSKAIPPNPSGPAFSVDTAAVAVMGFSCVLSMDTTHTESIKTLKNAQSIMLDLILKQKKSDGTIGNIYSTGLAGQALTAAQLYYPPGSWDCPLTVQKILQQIRQGTFSLPIAAAQVLPFLNGRSYLNVKGMQCQANNATLITVDYTIVNDLTGDYFKHSIQVAVPEGSTLLKVMEKAAEVNPKEFSFSTEETSWGLFITSINNLGGNSNQKTYWQFFSGITPLEEGVSTYKPHNKEHILAIFSKY
ncbi:cobalamin binding intrinsic factor [Spea bombifrons]|uniref:cobalamin binding intrinsic factor n=1 Tax=Spea bombifrons TaxID=233779 RepID=UPI002349C40E|nr:cobalamin binding intrinsic factor [Spea bombifrons]